MLKNRFALVMVAVVVIVLCSPVIASADVDVTEAIKGTPTLDGAVDAIWENTNTVRTDKWVSDPGYATADVRTMWDDDYFYVLMEVSDSLLSDASEFPWEKDSVEVFFDELNEKGTEYDANDGQYRVNFKNEVSGGGAFNAETFKSAAAVCDGGYIVEMAVPWTALKGSAAEGTIVGFDAQVNDDPTGTGAREGVVCWNDDAGDKYCNPSTLGNAKLVGVPDVAAGAANVEVPETSFNVVLLIIIVASVLLIGVVILLITKKKTT